MIVGIAVGGERTRRKGREDHGSERGGSLYDDCAFLGLGRCSMDFL